MAVSGIEQVMGSRTSYIQLFFDRGLRLAAGLAVVVAIPMAVLFYFQFKSLDDLEETSEVVLRQLSSDTAESLTRAAEDYLKRPHISVLLRIRLLSRLHEIGATRRAIVAFTETINGRPHYVQAQLRFEGPARDRMTSVVAFAVDAEKLRTRYLPSVMRDWMTTVQQPTGFPHLETVVLDETGAKIFASHPDHTDKMIPVDERSFAI